MKLRDTLMAGVAAVALAVAGQSTAWTQSGTEQTQEQAQEQAQEQPAQEQAQEQPAQEQVQEQAQEQAEEQQGQKKKKKKKAEQEAEQQPATEQKAEPEPQQQPATEQKAEPEPQQQQPATEQKAEPEPQQQPAQQQVEQAPAASEQAAEEQQGQKKKKKKKAEQEAEQQPATEQKAEPEPQQQQQPATEQKAEPEPQQQQPATEQKAEPEPQQQPAQQQAEQQEDPKPQFTAESVLGDERPAAELTDADLRERIRAAQELSGNQDLPKKQRRALRKKLDTDNAELQARVAASTGVAVQNVDVSKKVNEVTGDNRKAADLDDEQLRSRIQQTRGLLALETLNDRQRQALNGVLESDRAEIRARVAARDGERRRKRAGNEDDKGRSDELPQKGAQLTVSDLLDDERPAEDLTTSALERRIDANRRALRLDSLSDSQRRALRERMQDDRQALRDRLKDRRKRRRARLDDPAFAIGVATGAIASAIILSRPNIAAAEAYDEEIEDWLTAPPLVEVDRRYRVEDFRERPRLRYAVPGIELDTVRFGFGEGFLREEEIPKLERIGQTIERIVAGNPDEVFLIEGHTDAVGTEQANMALSVERAEAVKQALTEYFNIPEDSLETVGRGELYLKIPTPEPEAENRRVSVRRITPLLARN